MKNYIVIGTLFLLSFTGCKKDNPKISEKPKSQMNSLKIDESKSYKYIASSGAVADVSYQNDASYNTIEIKTTNTKFVLDKKDADENSQLYERNGIEAKLTKDSLFISQDKNVIELALSK